MSALPEQYQRYAQPRPVCGMVELHDDRDPIVHVPDAYGRMVPMRRSQAPAPTAATPRRDLTPQPVIDPLAQRMAAGGVLGAGVGWGAAQLVGAVASAGAGLAVFVLLLLAARLVGGGRAVTTVEVHQHASWFSSNRTGL